jgi:16S rRNA processing protein RimM
VKTGGVIPIATIVGAHGLQGTCKVVCHGEEEEIFEAGRRVLVKTTAGMLKAFEMRWFKPHGRTVLLALWGVDDRRHAEELIGCDIMVPKSALPELTPGTYYWHELIGLAVYSTDGRFLGRLTAVIPTGSNDVYVVRKTESAATPETLIPALRSVVVEVNLTEKRMRVNLPDGL